MIPRLENLSVIIPAYNEEGNLEGVVRELEGELPRLVGDYEILIVDDGSKDGTGALAEKLASSNGRIRVTRLHRNFGYGAAQRAGMKQASKDFVVLIPADGEFPIRDLEKLTKRAKEAHMVIGYRTDRPDAPLRKLFSRAYHFALRVFLGLPYRDFDWVKLYSRRVLEVVSPISRGQVFDAELLWQAKRYDFRTVEVPVGYRLRSKGRSSLARPRTLLLALCEALRLLLQSCLPS